ncbi:DUF6731 family protein [Paenibacillus woosongensis]|uniref:Uncharacterized protein n=1 Tax=Paenibacillus woosongensis TaxID=307580 RepID=A0A7X2YZQ3_9BACL|nr:DUF6731 family protein [Paenibacillus woosongensis]MUG44931.1 hypothetical protein [Paenibacillus woosongensis]
MSYRRVKFEYYQVWIKNKFGKESLFDLKQWMSHVSSMSLEKRAKDYRSERARLEEAYLDTDFNFHFLHFVRLRATNIPSKAKLDTNVEPFELEDDEFLGEEVSALYDQSNHVLMLQRNKFSLGPSGIEDYINLLWIDQDERVYLRPIAVPNSFTLARKPAIYRRLNLRLANVHKALDQGIIASLKSPLAKIVDSFGKYNGINAQITITVGQLKDLNLDEETVSATIDDIEQHQSLFTKAELAVKDHDDAPVEVIDLFDSKAHDYATFRLETRGSLNHYSLAEAMWQIYHPENNNRQSEITGYLS